MLISRFYLYSTFDSYIGQCEWILVLLRKRFILYCRSEEDAVERTERKKREKSSQHVCKEDKRRKKLKIERECEDEGGEKEEEEEEEVVTVGTSLSAAKSVKKGKCVKNLSTASGSKWPAEKEKAQAATKRLKRRKKHKISTSAAEKLTSARLKSYGF